VNTSIEKIPTQKTYSFSASREIPRLLCSPNVYYRVYRTLPLDDVLRQVMNSSHILRPYIIKICFNIILPSMLVSPV